MTQEALNRLLSELTIEEKIGQLVQIPLSLCAEGASMPTGPAREVPLSAEQKALAGSLIGDLPADAAAYASAVERMRQAHPHHIPPVIMRDVIHGCRTMFPIPLGIGATFDEGVAEDMARCGAAEAGARGVHAVFAPMVDVVRDPRWGRVMESPGESPALCAAMGAAMVRGTRGDDLTGDGLAACVKHFAGYGLSQAGHEYAPIDVSRTELYNTIFPPFEACVRAGADMVMTAFVGIDRVPAVCNPWLIGSVLRDRMGFDGMVISDWGNPGQLLSHGVAEDLKEAAQKCIQAGLDMDMMSFAYLCHLPELAAEGAVTEKQIDDACRRVLELKNKLGLLDAPKKLHGPKLKEDEIRALAKNAVLKACVLLKNDGVLPLPEGAKVALAGTHADSRALLGGWTLDADRGATKTFREAFAEEARVTLTSADEADMVVYCAGEGQDLTGEDGSRAHIDFPEDALEEMRALKQSGRKLVLVLLCGRPLVLTRVEPLCDAILNAWFPGSEGAEAVRELLTGDVSPSGHLSMTFPRALGQVPIHHDRLSTGRPWHEGAVYVNRYRDESNAPLYPFGWGLTYTRFDIAVQAVSDTAGEHGAALLRAAVRNTGKRDADCVLQMYARLRHGPLMRPDRTLVAWKRVSLKAGEEKSVDFALSRDDLVLWDAEGRPAAPEGWCDVAIGESSACAWNAAVRFA